MTYSTDLLTECPECDWPMTREDVSGTLDGFGDTAIGVRDGPLGHHEHARCPNCGFVVEPFIPAEPR